MASPNRARGLVSVFAGFVLGLAPAGAAVAEVTAPVPASIDSSFRDLGQGQPVSLRGVGEGLFVSFGVRLDQVVTGAQLTLRYTYSPALLPELSHLRVKLNDEAVASVPLPRETAGREVSTTIDLDPRKFTDYNQLQIQLIGHYTRECEDQLHSSLWATLSPSSSLRLQVQPLPLADDLALLPTPFFDRHDARRLELPFTWAGTADITSLEAAGIVASWFGALADYRGARFPVLGDALPSGNGLVLATNDRLPKSLVLTPAEAPTVSVMTNPRNPNAKLLVLQGRDAGQLKQAAQALVMGRVVMSGARALIGTLEEAPRRKAYDVPKWIPSDRPVRFGELVDDPQALERIGHSPQPIRINLRVPPDLFTWQQAGVPMDLRYRYSAPPEKDNSMLSVSINDEFVHAFALKPEASAVHAGQVLLPLLDEGGAGLSDALTIPAFQVGADNQLQFQFSFDYHKKDLCQGVTQDAVRSSLDPDSTVDVSRFPHYVALPNLALFANAGYPFTRYADLAETLVVLPDSPSASQIETTLFMLGRLGRHTGAPGTRVQLTFARDLKPETDRDLLVIDGRAGRDLLAEWREHLPVLLSDGAREFQPRPAARWYAALPWVTAPTAPDAGTLALEARGPISAVLGFESPLKKARSVVVVTSTQSTPMTALMDTLEDGGRIRKMLGDTVLLQANTLTSLQGGPQYHVGHLPLLTRLWLFFSRYPALLVLFALIAGLVGALLISRFLRRQAQRRLNTPGPVA